MLKIGITGGIGSGKTTAAKFLRRRLNAYLFDADKEAKSYLLSSIKLQNQLIKIFGQVIQNENGTLDLKKLAEYAFKNKSNQQILNEIIWPEVIILVDNAIKSAVNKYSAFIVDAALLIEAGLYQQFDKIILITAPKEIRIKRALSRKNLSLGQINKRILLQWPDDRKSKYADMIVKNDGTEIILNERLKKALLKLN